MEVTLVLTVGVLCISCFMLGAKVGQSVSKGEDVKLPTFNPVEAYREHKTKTESQKEQDRYNTIMRNIETYDGTSSGQREVR